MTDCGKIAELLSAYYDGELSDSECELVREHVDECESCAALLRLLGGVTDAFSDIEPPPELRERVMKSVRAVQQRRTANTKRVILWRVIPAAACLAVVLLALPMLINSGKNDSAPTTSGTSSADMASPPMEALMRSDVTEDGVSGEIIEDCDPELGAAEDDYVYDSGAGALEPQTFGDARNAQKSGASTEPQSPEGTPKPEDTPSAETPVPQIAADPTEANSANTATNTTTRAGDYSKYYAVIKVIGEFPQTLLDKLDEDHIVSYDANTREESIVIPRDIAESLIAEGYDYVLYNEAGDVAIVILAPDGR